MVQAKTSREIKEEIVSKRQAELNDFGLDNIKIIGIDTLGAGKRTGKIFFRLTEEKEVLKSGYKNPEIEPGENQTEKEIWEWFYEYGEDGLNIIAVRNPNTREFSEDGIMPFGLESIKEQKKWDEEERLDIRELEEIEKELEAIAKELGISKEEIMQVSELNLSQKIEQKEEEKQKEKENENENENESKQLSEEEVKKIGMTGMNEVKLNTKVDTKGTELGSILKLEGYTKLLVVHSYKLAEHDGKQGKNTINKFSLIAQKPDGTYEIISNDKLIRDPGSNSEVAEINNKDNVEIKNEYCRWQVPGTNYKLVIDQKDPYGIPDIYLSQTTRDNDGQIAQKLQDKYDGTERTDVEVRELFNANKGVDQPGKSLDEFKKIEGEEIGENHSEDCNETNYKDLDGDENTINHLHEESLIDFEGIKGARFDTLAVAYGGCESKKEVEELLKITNIKAQSDTVNAEHAIKLAIEERNTNLIQNSAKPEKVEELMEITNIKNPKPVIRALEASDWEIEEAKEILGRSRGEEKTIN